MINGSGAWGEKAGGENGVVTVFSLAASIGVTGKDVYSASLR